MDRQFLLEYSILEKERRLLFDNLEVNVNVKNSQMTNDQIERSVTEILTTTDASTVLRELRGSLHFKAIRVRTVPLRIEAPPLIESEDLSIFPPLRSKETPSN